MVMRLRRIIAVTVGAMLLVLSLGLARPNMSGLPSCPSKPGTGDNQTVSDMMDGDA